MIRLAMLALVLTAGCDRTDATAGPGGGSDAVPDAVPDVVPDVDAGAGTAADTVLDSVSDTVAYSGSDTPFDLAEDCASDGFGDAVPNEDLDAKDGPDAGDDAVVIVDPCEGDPCGENGRCDVVDGSGVCVCDFDYVPEGLSCVLYDPCALGTCYHMDSTLGDDGNPGTIDAPLRTYSALYDIALAPGDAVLFRRGRHWNGEVWALTLDAVQGTADAPIVFGAYGDEADGKPVLYRGLTLQQAPEHVIVRDLEITEVTGGVCLMFNDGAYVTALRTTLHDCGKGGVAYIGAAHHTVTADCEIYDIHDQDGISIHDRNWGDDPAEVGWHHWVVNNRVYDAEVEDLIDVSGAFCGDIKVLSNRLSGAAGAGVAIGHGGRYAWVQGNLIHDTGQTGQGSILLGPWSSNKDVDALRLRVRGNVMFGNTRTLALLSVVEGLEVSFNTVLGDSAPGFDIAQRLSGAQLHHNLVAPGTIGIRILEEGDPSEYLTTSNHNAWVPGDSADCEMQLFGGVRVSLADWQSTYGLDLDSWCAASPVDLPTEIGLPTVWNETLLSQFVPDATWSGCAASDGAAVGAFGCDGTWQGLALEPWPGVDEDEGYGWEGPDGIRFRYPMQ